MIVRFSEENAAFDENGQQECARILRKIAQSLEAGNDSGVLFDLSGNKVGEWSCERDYEAEEAHK